MSFRSLVIFLTILTTFTSWSLDERQFKRLNDELENHVNKGNLNKALQLTNYLLKKKLNENQRYQILTTKSKIYFWTENLHDYYQTSSESFRIKKNKSDIYKAYFFSQKAAYFHYKMLADSSVYFADKAMKLLKQNWKDRLKINYHLIYLQYANAFMYRKSTYANTGSKEGNNRLYILNICKYLDSAIFHSSSLKCFPQEISIIHRTKANRMMDVIGYVIRSKNQVQEMTNFQKSLFPKVISEYNKAIKCLSKDEKNLRIHLMSLKALAHFCMGEQKKGNQILWPIIKQFGSNPINEIGFRLNSSLYALQYFTEYLLAKEEEDKRIHKVIEIYKKLLPFWDAYSLSNQANTYGNSPYLMLSFIYESLFKNEPNNKSALESTVSLRLENYRKYSIYSKTYNEGLYNEKFQNLLLSLEMRNHKKAYQLKKKLLKENSAMNFLLQKIQTKLKDKEAFIFNVQGMLGRSGYFLICKNQILYESQKKHTLDEIDISETFDLSEFKRYCFEKSKLLPFQKIINSGKVKKLYSTIDIFDDFNFVIRDTNGSDFSKLSFLKKNINIIRVYNPIDFFSNQPKIISPLFHPVLIDTSIKQRLPFTENQLRNIFLYPKVSAIERQHLFEFNPYNLKQSGILHLLGHGKVDEDENSGWKNSQHQIIASKNKLGNNTIKSDLIVLNFCHGAYKRETFFPDRDLQNNLISRGAKAVIASPYETVDQSSAFIFKKFYKYIKQGITVEDALHQAKMDYLKLHKGSLAHPIYWSTYELTTNVRDLKLNRESNDETDFSKRIWTMSLVLFSLLVISFLLFKLFRKSPLN